jgi:polysaccharide chain length determinant protein (PEP-CTERM system associated)
VEKKHETVRIIGHYVGLVIRQRWLVIVPFCLAMVVGIILALTLTPLYEATTLILVSPPDVPVNIVRPIVSEQLESQMTTITQQVQSRSNLERIIKDFNLFSDPKTQNMFMEDKLSMLRSKIRIDLVRSRSSGGSSAFSISFQGNNPESTMKVANALASNFTESNLQYREGKAIGTSDFLESELENMRAKLEDTESKLSAFRLKHMGELPEQLQSNLQLLSSLETQLSNRQDRLRDERSRLLIAQNEVEQIRREAQAVRTMPGAVAPGQPQTGGAMTLPQLKEQLANLQSTYTERHPDVVRLKKMISDLEGQGPAATTAADGQNAAGPAVDSTSSPALREALRRRMEAEANIANIQTEVNQINQQMREYRLRIERTPQREEQLLSLKRDYDNIRQAYESLLTRKGEADMAVSLQKKNKGEQFRVIDHAKLPEKPVSPNMMLVFMMVNAAGLGFGFGLIFLLDSLNTSFRRPEEIESDLGIRLLAIIPKIYSPRDKAMARLNRAMTAASLAVACVLFAAFSVLALKGVQPTVDMLKSYLQS